MRIEYAKNKDRKWSILDLNPGEVFSFERNLYMLLESEATDVGLTFDGDLFAIAVDIDNGAIETIPIKGDVTKVKGKFIVEEE